jgi:hypothetical protein
MQLLHTSASNFLMQKYTMCLQLDAIHILLHTCAYNTSLMQKYIRQAKHV